jgi:UDP-N-acetyl-2-amino-2-deoxyglucuronate dehydrogenase
MSTFSIIGAAGYVAPRHMKAIQETGNSLVSVYDPCENLGRLDQYFPDAACFSDFGAYTAYHNHRHFFDYLSICSPNNNHFEQIKWGIHHGANIICEKPLFIHPEQLPILQELEKRTGKNINTILQLRLHPTVIDLKKSISLHPSWDKKEVSIEYITARGNWYFNSWKGREEQSGGIVTNIGIHLFDLLIWLFGNVEGVQLEHYSRKKVRGKLELERARVKWSLSIDGKDLPGECTGSGKRFFRQLLIDEVPYRLDEGMENLHTACYKEILSGNGPDIEDAAASILLCHMIRELCQ